MIRVAIESNNLVIQYLYFSHAINIERKINVGHIFWISKQILCNLIINTAKYYHHK